MGLGEEGAPAENFGILVVKNGLELNQMFST